MPAVSANQPLADPAFVLAATGPARAATGPGAHAGAAPLDAPPGLAAGVEKDRPALRVGAGLEASPGTGLPSRGDDRLAPQRRCLNTEPCADDISSVHRDRAASRVHSGSRDLSIAITGRRFFP